MRKNNYILLLLSSVIFLFLVSCQNESAKPQSTEVVNDTYSRIIKSDPLSKKTEVIIVDTFKTSEIRILHFIDKEDKNKLYEKQYHRSGEIYIEGERHNNLRTGKWVSWYKNKVIWSIGNYKNGKRDGVAETYYEDGSLRYSQNYKEGRLDGISKHYDINGNLFAEIKYQNDSIVWQKGK